MAVRSPRERLYEVFADTSRETADKIEAALEVGTDYLEIPIGFFTRIDDGTQEVVHAAGGHHLIQPGESCPLRDAYCRRTIEIDAPLAVQDVSDSQIHQRAVDTFGLGAYIGAKVTVDDELYGTVCFADYDQREEPFSEAEELFLELLANLVGSALERRAYQQDLRDRNERLEREKQRFQGIAENSFDILFRVGADARFTYVSSAVERVLSYRPEELVGEYFQEFMTDAAAETAAAAYSRVVDGEPVESLELDFLDRSGEVVVLEVNATPTTTDGEIDGIQGVGRDVTARKERQRELEMKTRAIDEAAVGISLADMQRPDEPLVYINEGFERLTGYAASAVLGRNCRFLQGEQTDPEAVASLREAIGDETTASVELVNYRRDGTPFWNRVQLSPVFDDDGRLTHYLGFQNDVTERKRTAQLIRLLNRVLRHNLRNDMTVLSGTGRLLRDGDADDVAALGERIERISTALVELSEHARRLERYARRDREPRRLDPRELTAEVVEAHRETVPNVSIDVDVRTERAICAGTELREGLSELVENAIKHNPTAEPQVRISVVDDGELIEVVVADDGPGITEMEADVVSTGRETPLEHGSGLGLWLVNWIVTRYGGSFQIDADGPDGNGGTTATVRLPALGPDDAVADAERGPTLLFF